MQDLPRIIGDTLTGQRFAWFGQRALDCVGLDHFLTFSLILCCDDGSDTDLVARRTGAEIVSLERFTGVREQWTNFSLEGLFDGPASGLLTRALSAQDRPLNVVAYCSTQGLEKQCRASKGRLRTLATLAALKHLLDDKIVLRRTLPALGLEAVPGQVIALGAAVYRELRGVYGSPLVVQFPIGAAGHRTFFVQAEDEFKALERGNPGAQVVVSKHVHGPAPNINVVVLDEAVLLSYPSIQLVGIRECTTWPAAYCGNDYPATRQLSNVLVSEIYRQARILAAWLQRVGFRGLFGIDFLTDGVAVYPIEINPRFQGSTHVLTQLQARRGEVPLALVHVLHFLPDGKEALSSVVAAGTEEPEELSGAQIILYSKERSRRIHHQGSVTLHAVDPDVNALITRNNRHLADRWQRDIWGNQLLSLTEGPGLRLNLGCGKFKLKGFINVDQLARVDPDVNADVLALPYDPGTVDEIYAGHLLEHFPFSDGMKALHHWHALLRPGGRISLSVPDYDVIARQYVADPTAEKLQEMNDIYIYSEHQESHHHYMYSGPLLVKVLTDAGFTALERMPVDHPYFPMPVDWQVGYTARKRPHAHQ